MADKRFNRKMFTITIMLESGIHVRKARVASFYGLVLANKIFSAMVKILFSVNTLGDPK
jgi:hypothetical protein